MDAQHSVEDREADLAGFGSDSDSERTISDVDYDSERTVSDVDYDNDYDLSILDIDDRDRHVDRDDKKENSSLSPDPSTSPTLGKWKPVRQGKGASRWSSSLREEEEAMWMSIIDPDKAIRGPPTAAQLQDLSTTCIKLIRAKGQSRKLVGQSLDPYYKEMFMATVYIKDPRIQVEKMIKGKLCKILKNKRQHCGQFPSADEAARAADMMKLKSLLCGWRPTNEKKKEAVCPMNYHPREYMEEMCRPEVVAITNPSAYRQRLIELGVQRTQESRGLKPTPASA